MHRRFSKFPGRIMHVNPNVDPIFELFFEIPYKKAGTLIWDRIIPKIG